jgi:pyruvate-formate lyase-activating enzyme
MTSEIHDFVRKLRDPAVVNAVAAGMHADTVDRRSGSLSETFSAKLGKVSGPISINLDLTVSCSYRCAHCIDAEILNTGHRYAIEDVWRSLIVLRLAGLRSVILIGGGEPTLHPRFRDVVRTIKALGLQCGIVSNGGNTGALEDVAPSLRRGDWIRLSLDAGSNDTFREMHLPRKQETSLQQICAAVPKMKGVTPELSIGFSFIIVWPSATVSGRALRENFREITSATALAKSSHFDYISFKPLLDRDELGAETLSDPVKGREGDILEFIKKELAAARALEDGIFRVILSLNLTAMLNRDEVSHLRRQPRRCHMRLFRQVLTPIGLFGCPVYRANAKDQIGSAHAYWSVEDFIRTRRSTFELREKFNATAECQNVTCLYNSTNRWLDSVHAYTVSPSPGEKASDFFL